MLPLRLQNGGSAVATLFGAAAAQSREWRRCAVSFSTAMRYFQRERSRYKWHLPGPGAQMLVSLAASKNV
jgi:hypothetical protein